jgi:ribosomal protein L4
VRVVEGDFSGKTKQVVGLINKLEAGSKGKANKVLFVVNKNENAVRGAHNIDGLNVRRVETLSTYEVVVSRTIIFLKDAVGELETRLTAK